DACRVPSGEPGTAGRFPANVLLDEHAAKEMDEQSGVLDPGGQSQKASDRIPDSSSYVLKRVADTPRYQDRGGASRFFPVFKYQAKADRKSTRLNSSHVSISYAVFCLT